MKRTKSRRVHSLPLHARPQTLGLSSRPFQAHRRAMREAVRKKEIPGYSQIVVHAGRIVYMDSHGLTDAGGNKRSYNAKTLVRLFSMTKPFTAVALLQAAEEGKLSLDDRIGKYLPKWRRLKHILHPLQISAPVNAAVVPQPTLRQLAMHTSGLTYGAFAGYKPRYACEKSYSKLVEAVDKGSVCNIEAFCDELSKLPLRAKPSDRWEYSHGFDVLGRVLEVVDKKPLDEIFKQRIFKRLRMTDTSFSVSRHHAADLAALYSKNENDCMGVKLDSGCRSAWLEGRSCPVLAGGGFMGCNSKVAHGETSVGGCVSTLTDYTKFVLALNNDGACPLSGARVLKKHTCDESMRDWLHCKEVSRGQKRVRGFDDQGRKGIGWCPFGQASLCAPEGKANVWMGGYAGTFFAIDRENDLVVLSVTQVQEMYDHYGHLLWEASKAAVMESRKGKQHADRKTLAPGTRGKAAR